MQWYSYRMKLLGIDYGDKRVGIAISDDSGEMAFPKEIIENTPKLIERVLDIIKNEDIKTIIIGESRDFEGKENPIMKRIYAFRGKLETQTEVPIYFEQEFLTSAEARRGQEDTRIVDSGAAAIILQSYIDKNKKHD